MNISNKIKNIVLFLVLLFSLIFVSGCSDNDKENCIVMKKIDFINKIPGKGTFEPVNEKEVGVPVRMYGILESLKKEGEFVKKGEIVAKINVRSEEEQKKWLEKSNLAKEIKFQKQQEEIKFDEFSDKLNIENFQEDYNFLNKKYQDFIEGPNKDEVDNIKLNIKSSKIQYDYEKKLIKQKEELFDQGYISLIEYDKFQKNLKINEFMINGSKNSLQQLIEEPEGIKGDIYNLELQKAKVSWENNKDDFNAKSKSRDLTYKNELKKLELDKKKLEKIQDKIEKSELKAPIDGVIMHVEKWGRKVGVGSRVWGGSAVVKITDFSVLKLSGEVEEQYVDKIKVNNKVEIRIDNYNLEKITGYVKKISRLGHNIDKYDPKSPKKFDVEILLDKQIHDLKPNFSADFMIIGETYQGVFKIPVDYVEKDGEKFYVYKKSVTGVKKINLNILAQTQDYYFVKDEIKEGDKIVFN